MLRSAKYPASLEFGTPALLKAIPHEFKDESSGFCTTPLESTI